MASSNIKLFDENKGNMLSDSEFNISTQRLNGLQTGVASSQLQNKAMYQASLVAYAIAQVMMQNGLNANDTDAVSAFVANLSSTMLQKVHDIATTEEAQAGTATGKWMSPALVKAAIDALAAKAQNILSDTTKTLYGLSSSAVPDAAFAKIAQQLSDSSMTLLWENASPTSEFAEQTITVNSSESNFYIIAYRASNSVDNKLYALIGVGESGLLQWCSNSGASISYGTVANFVRSFDTSKNSISFALCMYNSNDAQKGTRKEYVIPCKIYGVKVQIK